MVSLRFVILPCGGIRKTDRLAGRDAALRPLLFLNRQPWACFAAVLPQKLCTQKIGLSLCHRRLAAHQQHIGQQIICPALFVYGLQRELCAAKRVIQAEQLICHCGIDDAVNDDMHLISAPVLLIRFDIKMRVLIHKIPPFLILCGFLF